MSKREDQAFAAWAKDFKEGLETEELKEAFEMIADTDNARELYRGTLREGDYYTKLNKLNAETEELQAAQNELTEWYENEEPIREALIKERDELRKQVADGKTPTGNPPNQQTGISPEEFALIRAKAAKVDAIDKILPKVMGDLGAVLQDSMKNGYDVDAREIMQASVQQGIDPMRAYGILTQEQREKRAKDVAAEEKKQWFEEGRRAALSGDAPDHIEPSGPSIFDSLTTPDDPNVTEVAVPLKSRARVSEAVRQYGEGEF
jgi:hypothetical protein